MFNNKTIKQLNKKMQDYSWSRLLWEEIQDYIDNLPENVNDKQVNVFLKSIEPKIKCGKCRLHYRTFPKPVKFTTRNDVQNWFSDLRKDIQKQKLKGLGEIPQSSSRNYKTIIKSKTQTISKRIGNMFKK